MRRGTKNAKAVFAASAEFGAPLQGLSVTDFANPARPSHGPGTGWGFYIMGIPGVEFDLALVMRLVAVIDPETGLKANFISAHDLIASRPRLGTCP